MPSLLGDGILYFFSLVLIVGLVSDIFRDLMRPAHLLMPHQIVSLLMGLFVAFSAAWIGYFLSLLQRVTGKAQPDFLSAALAVLTLGFTLWVRITFGLW